MRTPQSLLINLMVIGALGVGALLAAEEWRDFRNLDGVVIKAKVLSIQGDDVMIRRSDGKDFTFALAALSPDDQVYLKTWQPSASASAAPNVSINNPVVGPVPSDLKLSSFYKKYVAYEGLPIVSSEKVPDEALLEARKLIAMMVAKNPRMVDKLVKNKVRVAVMASSELTTDIPEYSGLTPKDYWDKRARGMGATPKIPVSTCAEENLLNQPGDRYKGENIFVHEFAHTLDGSAISKLDLSFHTKLKKAYDKAIAAGLWKRTYAGSNPSEYWAEGVQSWFNVNMESRDGSRNQINTHKELQTYDPELYELIAQWMPMPTN